MKTKTKKIVKRTTVQESIVNDAPRTFTEADFPVGTVAHQGDLIFVRLSGMPKGTPRKVRQLAEGNTQGSRHILAVGDVFDCNPQDVSKMIGTVCKGVSIDARYIGPFFRTSDGIADVVHPEHGDHFYRGDMVIACVIQRSLDSEERERRVQD